MRPLIIFDFDGLLVNTETLFYKAVKKIAKEYGASFDFKVYVDEVVNSGKAFERLIGAENVDDEIVRRRVYDEYSRIVAKARLMPGAADCLERFKGNCDYVLATGSKAEYVDVLLEKFNLRRYFSTVVTRDDRFAPKPSPQIFRYLLEKHNRHPRNCIVIEDSMRGVVAAQKLGIPCIYIPTAYTLDVRTQPEVKRLSSLNDLTDDVLNDVFEGTIPRVDGILVGLYRDSIARIVNTFSHYKDIYDLPVVLHEDFDVEPEAFEYAKKRGFFHYFNYGNKGWSSLFPA